MLRVCLYEYELVAEDHRVPDVTRQSMRSEEPVAYWIRRRLLAILADAHRVCRLEFCQGRTVLNAAAPPVHRSTQHGRRPTALFGTRLRGQRPYTRSKKKALASSGID